MSDEPFGRWHMPGYLPPRKAHALEDAAWAVADASNRKDLRIAQLESAVTDLIGVIRALVSLAQPISLPTFRHVQQAVAKAQRAKDAA